MGGIEQKVWTFRHNNRRDLKHGTTLLSQPLVAKRSRISGHTCQLLNGNVAQLDRQQHVVIREQFQWEI